MHYLTSSKTDCPHQSLCLIVLRGSLEVKIALKGKEVGVVVSPPPPPSLGYSPARRHGTRPEMSKVTHSTLPRWPGNALCGQMCGGSEARRSRWLPTLETAARPCRGRSGSTKAKPHGSTPTQTFKSATIDFWPLGGSRNKLQTRPTCFHPLSKLDCKE